MAKRLFIFGDAALSRAVSELLAHDAVDPRFEALRAGDAESLEDLLRELFPFVRRALFRQLGPTADLDDVTQEALTAIAQALPRFEGRSTVQTFAHRIAIRTTYRYLRAKTQRAETSLELVAALPDEVDPESRSIHREALRRLYRALDRMPEKLRVAFVLCAVEGMTPTEAAEIEGIPAFVMRARLSRARKELERRLVTDPYLAALMERGFAQKDEAL